MLREGKQTALHSSLLRSFFFFPTVLKLSANLGLDLLELSGVYCTCSRVTFLKTRISPMKHHTGMDLWHVGIWARNLQRKSSSIRFSGSKSWPLIPRSKISDALHPTTEQKCASNAQKNKCGFISFNYTTFFCAGALKTWSTGLLN